jgi:hypothetical protein
MESEDLEDTLNKRKNTSLSYPKIPFPTDKNGRRIEKYF